MRKKWIRGDVGLRRALEEFVNLKSMALANALVGPALEAMGAPAPKVPFDEQLAQVAAEAEFKRLHNFEHGEALTKELAEAWAEHKDKAMAHAEKGLVDDGGDYSFEITSKLGATEKDVEHHLPEELLDRRRAALFRDLARASGLALELLAYALPS